MCLGADWGRAQALAREGVGGLGRPGGAALNRPIRKKFPILITDMARLNVYADYLHFSEGKWNS